MTIKRGNVVTHTEAHGWGAGKVVEVTPLKATIQFSDGIIRKIASSHYTTLKPAARASFVPFSGCSPAVKARTIPDKQNEIK
jgi:hypothetical protein